MFVLKFLGKALLFQVIIVIILVKWICVFIVNLLSIFFVLLAVIIFLTAILSYAFRLEGGHDVLRMLVVAFVIYMIPVTGNGIVDCIDTLQDKISEFLSS